MHLLIIAPCGSVYSISHSLSRLWTTLGHPMNTERTRTPWPSWRERPLEFYDGWFRGASPTKKTCSGLLSRYCKLEKNIVESRINNGYLCQRNDRRRRFLNRKKSRAVYFARCLYPKSWQLLFRLQELKRVKKWPHSESFQSNFCPLRNVSSASITTPVMVLPFSLAYFSARSANLQGKCIVICYFGVTK